ncbi:Cytochrome b5 type B (outer mitochondrial membrane) [Cichlidogyrus casuarinus]|uniref:Cytochrome b5 n=1 Tax=Cichlidogyrus casuarinus TaxID=1844966 RepID=A0ABD2Q913_9PLAT
MEEVKKHNAKNDVYICIHNKVYDLTSFLIEHPGGDDVLLEHAGAHATQAFEDVGHSEDAREMMRKYLIGHVIEASAFISSIYFFHFSRIEKELILWSGMFIPVTVGLVAIAFGVYALRFNGFM